MKVSDLSKEVFDQLVELECVNIIPVLASVGINLTKEIMINELNSFKDDQVVTYKVDDLVEGFIVYKVTSDHILIKTFNLKKSNSRRTLVGLLKKIVIELEENEIDLIVSHCHLTNTKSLNLHRGLGFKENKKTDKLIEFHVNRSDIIKKISRKTTRIS